MHHCPSCKADRTFRLVSETPLTYGKKVERICVNGHRVWELVT